MTKYEWLAAPTNLTLLPDEVHIWRVDLDKTEAELENLAQILSSDEVSRGQRFYFPHHRQRFVAARGILRIILSSYLEIEPQQLQFDYEPRGKPVLADTLGGNRLWFNLSHSENLGLYAVSGDRAVGVDLEYIREMSDIEGLAKRFFSPREYTHMRSLPPSEKQSCFFRYWTCKEAYLKATGAGLSQLDQVEILLSSTEPASLQTSEKWSLLELVPANNYLAAVAVAGENCDLKCWKY